jgi:two-component system cell cycle response regulator
MQLWSLRLKITLAFLAVSLTTVLLSGTIAQTFLLHSFSVVKVEAAFADFKQDVTSYIETYGSWQAAQAAEGFGQFERRQRALETLVGTRPLQAANCASLARPAAEMGVADLENASIPINNKTAPPFRFLLVDLKGETLLPRDRKAPRRWQQAADPIEVDGQVVAFAIMDRRANWNDIDQGYLDIVHQSLVSSLLISGAIALILGFFLAQRLSQPVVQLIDAVQNMEAGNLRQRVAVASQDEMGRLGKAFNTMSQRLADAYDALEQSQQRFRELSTYDELTQLNNRRFFNGRSTEIFGQAEIDHQPLSLMIGDVDHFKRINDTFSHGMGDLVLAAIGQILRRQVRPTDLVARYGGEEFVVLFPHTCVSEALVVCERLRAAIEAYPWHTLHPDLAVTMSMGVNGNVSLGSVEKMLAAADTQLYEAKRSGRNRVLGS